MYECPKCGDKEKLDVSIQTWARVKQRSDGPDDWDIETDLDEADEHDHEWDSESTMRCRKCGNVDQAYEFDTTQWEKCGDCGKLCASITGCPDGAEVCKACLVAH